MQTAMKYALVETFMLSREYLKFDTSPSGQNVQLLTQYFMI